MKTLIVYYSLTGNVDFAARTLSERIGADTLRLEAQKAYPDKGFKKFFRGGKSAVTGEKPALVPYSFDAAAYNRIVFGSPVWAGTFAPPLRTFIEENAETARTYGTQAIQSAEAASTYQQQAAGSAQAALESRNAAQTSAQAAQVSAQSAAESYGGAEAAKSAAVSAKNAAQAAQQAVEENLDETRNWRFYLDDGDLMFERTVY